MKDGWTVVTRDRSLSAQWEHMVAVTDTGFEVLTPWPDGYGDYAAVTAAQPLNDAANYAADQAVMDSVAMQVV